MTRHTLVVAEAGSCHDGELKKALTLIDVASIAKVDVVKFQYWSDPDALADRRRVPSFYREFYARYKMPLQWLHDLREACHAHGLLLGVTTYLPQDVAPVASYADVLKIASFEAEAQDLLDAHLPYLGHKPVLVSLGMDGHKRPVAIWRGAAVRYLRCVSAYPAPVEDLHLQKLWGSGLGLSDHTDPALTWTGALAVAAGAPVVEAHLKVWTTDPTNPDAPHAMLPDQFRDYVRHIRFAEACVGDGEAPEGVLPSEEPMAAYKVRAR